MNYGLYLPPANGRAGKFLLEERLLDDYGLSGPVAQLEVSACFCCLYAATGWRKWIQARVVSCGTLAALRSCATFGAFPDHL
jgi:hypothetical protein